MALLVSDEILGVFVYVLTGDGKYPVAAFENLILRKEMQLSEKRKTFLNFFLHFWILHQSLTILKEKMMVIAKVLPKLRTVNILIRSLSKKRRFRMLFDIEHGKGSQILEKSP